MPDVPDTVLHVLEWLYEVGPVISDSMGRRPLRYDDLTAWMQLAGPLLTPWEASTLVQMSSMYSAGLYRGERGEPMPMTGDDDEDARRRTIVNKILDAVKRRGRRRRG